MVISAPDSESLGATSFPLVPAPLMVSPMDGTTLSLELDRSAVEAVAAGRGASREEAIAVGVRLWKECDAEVSHVVQSLEDARESATRDVGHSLDDVLAEADDIIAGTRGAGPSVGRSPKQSVTQHAPIVCGRDARAEGP